MKCLLFFLITILLISCVGPFGNKSIKVRVLNSSNSVISNVKITTSENLDSLFFPDMDIYERRSGNLNMKKNKTDGEYRVSYKQNGKYHFVKEGYYTNGRSLNYSMNIVVKSDTVLIKF
jgi:hypothetical protein